MEKTKTMSRETLRSLQQIQNLIDAGGEDVRFMKLKDVIKKYCRDRRALMKAASECGALYKVNNIVLIEMRTFEPYYNQFYVDKEEACQ